MEQEVNTKKTIYNQELFDRTVSREFNTYTAPAEIPTISVDEFFVQYDRLYLEIPVLGNTNSHEFIIQKSSELTGTLDTDLNIQQYLDEIALLREQLLEANKTIVDLRTQIATNGN